MKRAHDTIKVVLPCVITSEPVGESATDGDEYCANDERNADGKEEYREISYFAADAHDRKPFRTTESHETLVWPSIRCE